MYGGGGGGGQWPNQQQQGYMQPQQTGYMGMPQQQRPMMTGMPQQQQHMQQGPGFIGPQATGMNMGGMGMGMQPQATGMGMQPQQTGMGGGMNMGMGMGVGLGGMRQPSYGQQTGAGMLGGGQQRFLSPNPMQMQPQQTGMMQSSSPRPAMGLQPQATGYPGNAPLQMQQTGLVPQMTGMPMDPRLQLMSMQFLPASQPFSGAPMASNMNFNSASMQPASFQSSIQNLSQQQQGSKEPKIPWALSKEERKSYDSIFRAWDQKGTGFVSGEVAREVFGQSGLDRDRLMQIWHLSDTENRGKLNLAEFHVAMGLIYRALNGNDLPEHLPPELVPPSARDLSESVDFLKDLLKRDTNVRHTTGLNLPESGSNSNTSYGKSRSFHENPIQKQDAAAYKHSDVSGTGYKSSSRHLDRRTVRYGGESATDDLSEMKRQLAHTQKMLDSQEDKDEEDREVEKEMDELRFRIKRVQDDIDYYNRRGGRDAGENRRKAERELLHLMHERLPLLEKRLEDKDKKAKDKRVDESRNRDRRNESFENRRGYSDDRRDYSYSSRRGDEDDYSRSRTPTQQDRDRGDYRRDRDRTPPPPPPPAASTTETSKVAPAPPAPPAVAAVSAPAPPAPTTSAPTKSMTPEERQAWIRSEAQRRIAERMRALGAAAPPSPSLSPATTGQQDASVEQRLAADRAEAEAKSAQADAEAAAREQARRARLEEQKIEREKAAVSTIKSELKEQEKSDSAPPALVMQAAREEVKEQEEMLRRREEVLQKEKEERLARFKKLEEEEEEAKRQEEQYKQRQGLFQNKATALPAPSRKGKGGPPPPPPSRNKAAPTPATPTAAAAPQAPPETAPPQAPPAPPAPVASAADSNLVPVVATPSGSSSTNPFHRMQPKGGVATTPGGTNPFYRPQQDTGDQPNTSASASSLPAPQRAAAVAPSVSTLSPSSTNAAATGSAPKAPVDDDDWGEDHDNNDDDDDDADGPGSTTRATRQNLAQALFSGLVPTPPPSTPPPAKLAGHSVPASPAPPTAPQPPAPPAPPAAPAAPAAPVPSAAPSIPAPASGPADRGALLGQIQGGLRLRKAQTNDRSAASVSGAVIGDASAPVQKFVPHPSPPSPAAPAAEEPSPIQPLVGDDSFVAKDSNRQSVDWASHLASDQMNGNAKASVLPDEPSVREEEEDSGDEIEAPEDSDGPSLAHRQGVSAQNGFTPLAAAAGGEERATGGGEELDDFDLTKTIRVRSLYPYEGQREEDLTFVENSVINAHPAKDESNDWWYGTLITNGKGSKGTFPRTYVQSVENPKRAKALYDFQGSSPEELDFTADQELHVVDDEDENWWKVIDEEQRILIVPSTYVALVSSTDFVSPPAPTDAAVAVKEAAAAEEEESVVVPPVGEASSNDKLGAKEEVASTPQTSTTTDAFRGLPFPLDEEVELQKVLMESEREARLQNVARAREDKDLKRALEMSAQQDTAAGSDTSDDAAESDSTTGWTSSEDEPEGDEGQEEESEEAKQLRAAERIRVLEAAGILVLDDQTEKQLPKQAEDKMLRRKTVKKSKPERPERVSHKRKEKPSRPNRPPPLPPKEEKAPEVETEDAYDRYVKMSREVVQVNATESSGLKSPRSVVTISPPSSPTPSVTTPSLASTGSGLLSTIRNMSRMGASSPAERRPTPTISGPMAVRTNSPSVGESGQAQAAPLPTAPSDPNMSSWSSLIGSQALTEIPELERKRQEAIFELIRTEGTHVRDLQIIVEVFFNAMQAAPFLSIKARTVIFANVEEVLLASVSLLSDLESRQKDSRLYVTRIGDILNDHMKKMHVYLPYCVNQSPARHILMSERSRNTELEKLLQDLRNQHPAARGLDLSSFLLIPMQRLTRYPLLISQIVRYTDTNIDPTESKDLRSAIQTSQNLLDMTNEAIRARESKEKLETISQNLSVGGQVKLDLTKPTRWMGERTIIKEDILTKQKSSRKIDVVLCSDILLLLYGDRLYRMPLPLEEIVVRDVPPGLTGRDDLCFQIVHQGREKTNLRCASARACHSWMHSIDSARSECLAAANKTSRSQSRIVSQ